MKVLKKIFNNAVLKRHQQYLMRILQSLKNQVNKITPQNMLYMIVFFLYCGDSTYSEYYGLAVCIYTY